MPQILYTCHGCGLSARKVTVPARMDGEDVVAWMNRAMVIVGRDHKFLSPFCTSQNVDLAIPTVEDKPIGDEKSPDPVLDPKGTLAKTMRSKTQN